MTLRFRMSFALQRCAGRADPAVSAPDFLGPKGAAR